MLKFDFALYKEAACSFRKLLTTYKIMVTDFRGH
jgi:hypothetical protein